jgi:DNA segregation ATPase FtsK/SpoIIIE, S-DNA-T family
VARKKKKKAKRKKISADMLMQIKGVLLIAFAAFAIFGLLQHEDTGGVGQFINYLLKILAGKTALFIPIALAAFAFQYLVPKGRLKPGNRLYGLILLALLLAGWFHRTNLIILLPFDSSAELFRASLDLGLAGIGGGLIGSVVAAAALYLFGQTGSMIIGGALALVAVMLIINLSIKKVVKVLSAAVNAVSRMINAICSFIVTTLKNIFRQIGIYRAHHKAIREEEARLIAASLSQAEVAPVIDQADPVLTDDRPTGLNKVPSGSENQGKSPVTYEYQPRILYPEADKNDQPEKAVTPKAKANNRKDYQLPSFDLLSLPGPDGEPQQQKSSKERARKLENTLLSFGVKAKVVHVQTGPTVTRFEVQPEAGVKVSRFISLADDLALNLAAPLVRIEAPIPGKAALGIEVPNSSISLVHLREVMENTGFLNSPSPLTVALGKDITGVPIIADLTKMPHLLIAGATGAGKSVCLNTIITSILYKSGPEQVRFMMIDPKVVELSVYNGISQLLMPVLTDPRKAALALKNMVREMGRRYDLFAQLGIRDIGAYNEMADTEEDLEKLAYIVVVIDELADLMLVSPGEVEDTIARLAQMSRAAGIHLLVATQRPSVDVLTGIIKANITSRIAFTVSSQVDSRTILDMAGAEKLLGRGDMLYYPVGSVKPFRVQGAYVSEIEVKRVTDFIREQGILEEEAFLFLDQAAEEEHETEDKLFPEAVDLVVRTGQASISLLQRRFRIGYTRAARLIDDLERKGIVGPFEGSKPREVLITEDEVSRITEDFLKKD